MLILTETKDHRKLLLGIKIKIGTVIGMLKDEEPFKFLLGMFFINNYDSNDKNVIKDFCLVFPQKLKIYTINLITDLFNEIVSLDQTYILNTNFDYNLTCSVLCIEKDNISFTLHNLSHQMFYKSEHYLKLPNRTILKRPFFTNKDETKECKKIIQTLNTKVLKYKRFQVFLEVIISQLFLINYSFEENKILLYSIINLDTIELKYDIDIRNHSYYSTLQFIDNLIVVYNFFKKETTIFDIGAMKGTVNEYSVVNTQIPYDKEILINGKMIIEKDDRQSRTLIFYYVSFCKTLLYDMTPPKEKHKAIISLFQRKQSKEIIFGYMRQMILARYKMKYMKMIYMQMVEQLKGVDIDDKKPNEEGDKSNLKSVDFIKPTDYIFIGQNSSIKQGDVMLGLFKTFEKEIGIEDLIIENMISLYHCMANKNIPVLPCFHIILKIFLHKISIEKLLVLLRSNFLPESYELAKYIMEIHPKDSKITKALEQYGLDILIKLGKSDDVFDYLYQKNRLDEAMFMLLSKNPQSGNIFNEKINEIMVNNINLVLENIDLLSQYYNEQFN